MKNDDVKNHDSYDIRHAYPMSRRDLFRFAGGGLFILFSLGNPLVTRTLAQHTGVGSDAYEDFNAFLRIREDGRVSCFTGKIEMGQGVITSLAQMLADELEVPLDSVDMVMGDTALCPYDMGTFGSMTTRFFGPDLRKAAAAARSALIEMAAEHLNTDPSVLLAKDGIIYHRSRRSKKVSYAELTRGKRIVRRPENQPALEKPSDFNIAGTPVLRRDAEEKVTGKAKFAGDFREPGMLYAKIVRPPAHGSEIRSIDTAGIKKIKGARLIKVRGLIAVLHEDPELAEAALNQVRVQWTKTAAKVDHTNIFDHLLKVAPAGNTIAKAGSLNKGEELSTAIAEKTYLDGYVAHAPIEPHTALAKTEGSKVIIRASTQTPFPLQREAASALGLPVEDVRVITPFVGGGFGGKTNNKQAMEAALLAKASGRPVMVAWTRAEEFFYDTFRPAAVVKIKAGINDSGQIAFWDYGVYFAGDRGAAHFYDIPNHRTVSCGNGWRGTPGSHPFNTGAWRAPGNNTNTFSRESHIDLLASEAGMDPLEFRLKNLKNKRMIRVLKACAEQFGWKPGRTPSGLGRGLACGIDAGTYLAHMAEVEVNKNTGHVSVKRVVCAQDMGFPINPGGAKIQIEGCITMGLGYALKEDIRFKGGAILDRNFDTYEIPKFSWLPKIETVLIKDIKAAPQGGGEPAIICMGGVIANAIHDALGVRLYQLPMSPERVKQALKQN